MELAALPLCLHECSTMLVCIASNHKSKQTLSSLNCICQCFVTARKVTNILQINTCDSWVPHIEYHSYYQWSTMFVTLHFLNLRPWSIPENTDLMWDSPLYAMNRFYYHWRIKKHFGLWQGRVRVGGKTKLNTWRQKVESGRCHVAAQESRGNKSQVLW